MDSVIVPAMQKYGILVKAALDIQNREIHVTVGRTGDSILTIEADLPNIIKNSVTIKQVNDDGLVKPEQMEFGQQVEIISDGVAYRSILTGRERGKNTKLVFGTVRLDLTKILRRSGNG